MYPAALDMILKSPECRGAYKVDGADIAPLSGVKAAAGEDAARTRDIWARVGAQVSDSGLMIAKREDALSIASLKGGLILETSGPVNIGILKAALQNEDAVRPEIEATTDEIDDPGLRALWSLATWVEAIETPRLLRVTAGKAVCELVARKGRFQPLGKVSPSGIADTLLAAGNSEHPITLTYGSLPSRLPQMRFAPLDLLCAQKGKRVGWIVAADGRFNDVPGDASLGNAKDIFALAKLLGAWGGGRPFEVAILQDNAIREVIAHSDTSEHIHLTARLTKQ